MLTMKSPLARVWAVYLGLTCTPVALADASQGRLGVAGGTMPEATAIVSTPTLKGSVAVQSWKDRRDASIVKQDLDFSCGASSLATVLNGFYGKTVTEEEILKVMNMEDDMASFADMAAALPHYGFKGVGLALSFSQLQKIKVPAIVYLRYRGDDHFSVLRGISENTVWLGDPSWGNRRLSMHQFLEMWETRDNSDYKGKVLLILPSPASEASTHAAFFHAPGSTSLPVELLGIRQF